MGAKLNARVLMVTRQSGLRRETCHVCHEKFKPGQYVIWGFPKQTQPSMTIKVHGWHALGDLFGEHPKSK